MVIFLRVEIQFLVSPFWGRIIFDKCCCLLTNVADFWSDDVV